MDYAQGSLVPCMENIVTEDHLNEVKAGKSCSVLVRLASERMSGLTAGNRKGKGYVPKQWTSA